MLRTVPRAVTVPISPSERRFSSAALRLKFSLAERIKQFLPDDAAEVSNGYTDLIVEDESPAVSLAAYEAEVSSAVSLVEQFQYKSAGQLLLSRLPLQAVSSALVSRIIPAIRGGATRELGVLEFMYGIYEDGQYGLVSQLLQEITQDAETSLRDFAIISSLGNGSISDSHAGKLRTSVELDRYLHAVRSEIDPFNFPQILSRNDVSAWLKVHLLVNLTAYDFKRWLSRYAAHFDSSSISLLLLLLTESSTDVYSSHIKSLADWITKNNTGIPDLIPRVMDVLRSPDQFHIIYRRLVRQPPKNSANVTAMLAAAIRLKQTYDIANICKHCKDYLHHPEHDSLLAKALLAAAFAQHKPTNKDPGPNEGPSQGSRPISDSMMPDIVAAPNDQLYTFLVRRVLTPVLNDPTARNAVISRAAARLYNLHAKVVPGKVLWQLIMSLPGPLCGPANVSLARLVVKRPYVEQIRYMSLPIVSSDGIAQVLRWHITKIMEHRRMNGVDAAVPQAEEDIQLLVVGMLLASEKQQSPHAPSTVQTENLSGAPNAANADELRSGEQSLSGMISKIFENHGIQSEVSDNAESGRNGIDSAGLEVEKIAATHFDRELSASIAFYVIAELVRQKSYTVAKQLLKTIGPSRVSQAVFNNLLLNLAADQPEDSYKFVVWLVKMNNVSIQPHCINEMLRILTRSALSESQLMNRFQGLRMLLKTSLKSNVEPKAAADLVDAFIKSAYNRGRGSQLRLKWSLEVARQARVADSEFDRWNRVLANMQENRQGYWSGWSDTE